MSRCGHGLLRIGATGAMALALVELASCAWAADAGNSQDTQRILAAIDRSAARRSEADRRAAQEMNAQGDLAYRKGDYRSAFTAYSNSYPNYPTAHAYILAGDAHWRDVVQYAREHPPPSSPGPAACVLDNRYFAHDLSADVAQHHAVGIALANRAGQGRQATDPLISRARESADCLLGLAKRYEQQPPATCVDMSTLQRCLGEPLVP